MFSNFCFEQKVCLLHEDERNYICIPIIDYENCREGDIVGFYVKLENEKDIYHELSYEKRLLEGKELKYKTIEEVVVEIHSFFKMLQFKLYSFFSFKD